MEYTLAAVFQMFLLMSVPHPLATFIPHPLTRVL